MILLVDDDTSVLASLGVLLERHGHSVQRAESTSEALDAVEREPFDLVVQDMNFSRATSGEEGLELLRAIRSKRPKLPVILITAWGSIDLAVEGMKAGASDFITKPWSNAQLIQSVETALELAASSPEKSTPRTRRELDERFDFSGIVGEHPEFLPVLELVGRVAPTEASVLIQGESGTGKELIAEAIHRNSRRRDRPFVKVNLGGLSSTLFESEMFGHVRGAFTDAQRDRKGRFEVADGGTIFLDEIGDVDPNAQVKLLRVLQDRTYEPLGSSRTKTVDVRVISATNRDLKQAVADGSFREDLLYRINLIMLHLPPLRRRRSDIALLASDVLERCARRYGTASLDFTPEAVGWLEAQPWPGNVRELQQTIERAVLVVDGSRITESDLMALSQLGRPESDATPLPSPGSMTLEELEQAMIRRCLEHFSGNVSRAADALGLSRPALYRRMEKYGLDPR